VDTVCLKMASRETAIRHEDVAVRIESEKIAEGLDGDDGAGDGIVLWNGRLEKDFQGFPCTATKACPREGGDRQGVFDRKENNGVTFSGC
jgi:hypothetical protein